MHFYSLYHSKNVKIGLLGSLQAVCAILTWLANAPAVRGCSALRARSDMFVALYLGNANGVVGVPGLRSMRESFAAILHSHPARLRAGLGAAHGGRSLTRRLGKTWLLLLK